MDPFAEEDLCGEMLSDLYLEHKLLIYSLSKISCITPSSFINLFLRRSRTAISSMSWDAMTLAFSRVISFIFSFISFGAELQVKENGIGEILGEAKF